MKKVVFLLLYYGFAQYLANFGKGIGIRIGDNSGLGVNCSVRGPLDMGANIMMGPDVTILTSIHNTVSTDIPMNQQGGRPIKR